MKIRVTSTDNLMTFLKKLKVVDRSILLELTEDKFFCKVHTPDKSVMKYASIDVAHIFDPIEGWEDIKGGRIKIGLMDVSKLIECFKHFRAEEDIFLELNIQEIDGENVTSELNITSNSLKIRIKCADLILLSYVEDKVLSIVHSKEDAIANFKIYNSDFSSVVSLIGLEANKNELLVFRIDKEKVSISGDSFDYNLNIGNTEILTTGPSSVSIYKSHLNYVDSESCACYVHENRIIFFSEQSDSSTAIGIIEE